MRGLGLLMLLMLLMLPIVAGAEEIPVDDVSPARATALSEDAASSAELLDLVFYEIRTAEELRQLLQRDRIARAIRADTVLLRVLHDRLVHRTVAEATGQSLENLEEIYRALLRNPRRAPSRGVRLEEIHLLEIPRLDDAYATSPASPSSPAAPPAPPTVTPPPGRWTRWGWVQGR